MIADCDEPCPGGGSWNVKCTRCECPENTLTGRVLSTYHTPLAGVLVSLAGSSYDVINTTDTHGVFVITSACIGQTLLFKKQGYVDEMYLVTTLAEPAEVPLKLIGRLCSNNKVPHIIRKASSLPSNEKNTIISYTHHKLYLEFLNIRTYIYFN